MGTTDCGVGRQRRSSGRRIEVIVIAQWEENGNKPLGNKKKPS